jgi:hypothetical protein
MFLMYVPLNTACHKEDEFNYIQLNQIKDGSLIYLKYIFEIDVY